MLLDPVKSADPPRKFTIWLLSSSSEFSLAFLVAYFVSSLAYNFLKLIISVLISESKFILKKLFDLEITFKSNANVNKNILLKNVIWRWISCYKTIIPNNALKYFHCKYRLASWASKDLRI